MPALGLLGAATFAPPARSGGADAIALVVLLTQFAMLRAPLARSQVRLYAWQSTAVSALAIFLASTRHAPDLYALAALSFSLKAVLVPRVVLRLLRDAPADVATSSRLGVATTVLVALALSVFGFFVVGRVPIGGGSLPAPALGMAAAVVLVAFLLAVVRADVVSQAVGFFSLENGVSVAGLVVASGLPLLVEVAFLFDLLAAAVAFGILMRAHHSRAKTLSADVLGRLRG
ncbi:MAG TPA: hypothetical protein VKV23_10585 [Acidimicrobiales bacterium]|nr:hypothetical protein [Acidimicrobiales bacterium]